MNGQIGIDQELTLNDLKLVTGKGRKTWLRRIENIPAYRKAFVRHGRSYVTTLTRLRRAQDELGEEVRV